MKNAKPYKNVLEKKKIIKTKKVKHIKQQIWKV